MGREFEIRYEEDFIAIDFLKEVRIELLNRAFGASGKYRAVPSKKMEGVLNIFTKGNRAKDMPPHASVYAEGGECKSIFLAKNDRNTKIAEELEGQSEVGQAINTLVFKLYERREPKHTGNSPKPRVEIQKYVRHLTTTSPLFSASGKTALLRNNIGEETMALMHKLGTPAYSPKTNELRLSLNRAIYPEVLGELLQGCTHSSNQQGMYNIKSSYGALIAAISPKKIVFHQASQNTPFIKVFVNKLCKTLRRK